MKVLLIDDHPLVREGVSHVLQQLPGSPELLMATSGAQGVALARSNPDLDLVLLDLALPDMRGLDGLTSLRRLIPAVPVVILSAAKERVWIQEALRRGAAGYIPKSHDANAMRNALLQILDGAVYVPPVAEDERAGPQVGESAVLTPRQRDVLQLLAQGQSNKEIANVLGMTEGTVRIHVTAILKALGVDNRTEAARAAVRAGLVCE